MNLGQEKKVMQSDFLDVYKKKHSSINTWSSCLPAEKRLMSWTKDGFVCFSYPFDLFYAIFFELNKINI